MTNGKFKVLMIVLSSLGVAGENSESGLVSEDGYSLNPTEESLPATLSPGALECPSSNLIRTRYKCKSSKNEWVDCSKAHCCPGYIFIGGFCIEKGKDPCTLNLCEQRCSLLLQRVICTCWDGYRFSPERQKRGVKPACVDIDECVENSADCEQLCINQPGGFSCGCNDDFVLRGDNKTCEKLKDFDREKPEITAANDAAAATRCYASCDSVVLLHDKVRKLQEKVSTLETAIKLSSYFSGPVNSFGSPGSLSSSETSKSKGSVSRSDLKLTAEGYITENEKTYSILDSFIQTDAGYCKCQRGPIGPSGPPGATGQKGEAGEKGARGQKGAAGSFDFLLFLLADIRHDIVLLQEKVFSGKTPPPKLDLQGILRKHRLAKERNKFQKEGSWGLTTKGGYEDSEDEITEASGWDQYED